MSEKHSGQEIRSENDRRLGYDTRTEAEHRSTSERRSKEDRRIGLDGRFDLEVIMEKCGIEPENLLEKANMLSDLIKIRQKETQIYQQRISDSINNGGSKLELERLTKNHLQIMVETQELRKQLEQVQLQLHAD